MVFDVSKEPSQQWCEIGASQCTHTRRGFSFLVFASSPCPLCLLLLLLLKKKTHLPHHHCTGVVSSGRKMRLIARMWPEDKLEENAVAMFCAFKSFLPSCHEWQKIKGEKGEISYNEKQNEIWWGWEVIVNNQETLSLKAKYPFCFLCLFYRHRVIWAKLHKVTRSPVCQYKKMQYCLCVHYQC